MSGKSNIISKDKVLQSVLRNRTIDCSGVVLRGEPKWRDREYSVPPVLIAAFQQYPPGGEGALSLLDFEALSLAARTRLLGLKVSKPAPWLMHLDNMSCIRGADLVEALHEAAHAIRFAESGDAPPPDLEHLPQLAREAAKVASRARRGLQIIGARIEGGIDLTNAQLPFSVRLIGCAISGAVLADRAEFVTLDLSGCALEGVFATFAAAKGSVRMRRMLSTSVVDFGGARVADVFDASDAVVIPLHRPPKSESFVGDRGVFNLSLASIQNEMRFSRARIYGGLTLKGCVIHRSLFMDDAILRAPLAVAERAAYNLYAGAVFCGKADDLSPGLRAHARAEAQLASEMHPNTLSDAAARQACEVLEGFDLATALKDGDDWLLRRLLGETLRARTSCLRADGIDVRGSVHARSLRSGGRLRLKYVTLGGGLHLNGARLRCSHSVQDGVDVLLARLKALSLSGSNMLVRLGLVEWLERLLGDSLEQAKSHEPTEDDGFALDLRSSRVMGSLELGPDQRSGSPVVMEALRASVDAKLVQWWKPPGACRDAAPAHPWRAWIERRLAALRRDRARDARENRRIDDENQRWREEDLQDWRAAKPDVHPTLVLGRITLADTRVSGDLHMQRLIANQHREGDGDDAKHLREGRIAPDDKPFLDCDQCEIDGDFDLCGSIGVSGVTAHNIRIGGNFRMSARPELENGGYKRLALRALKLGGKLQFTGASIGGDAVFLFDRDDGPTVLLGRSRTSGRLAIMPARGPVECRNAGEKIPNWILRRAHLPVEGRESPRPEIDLRSARAQVFAQPATAWPHPNELHISGFTFDQVREYGPLHPRRRARPQAEDHVRLRTVLLTLAGAIAALALATGVHWNQWQSTFAQLGAWFGFVNVVLLAGIVGLEVTRLAVGRFTRPRLRDALPLATNWLELQRRTPNVYRTGGNTLPLQPYLHASKVLREAGMVQPAGHVELCRLKARRTELSWRLNFPAKSFLYFTDAISELGFAPVRTIAIALFTAVTFACFYDAADRCGLMHPMDGELVQAVGGLSQVRPILGEPGNYPGFNSTIYALDVMVPGLELGQDEYWRPMPAAWEGAIEPAQCNALTRAFAAQSIAWLKVIGWLLLTAIALALFTRIEAMMARNEE